MGKKKPVSSEFVQELVKKALVLDVQESLFADVPQEPVKQPLAVSYGVGVDSTAMLVAMYHRGIRPDIILFADPGGEKPETYDYIPIMNAWLKSVSFPEITIVSYKAKRAKYSTLEGKCLNNETLPSLAFGRHSCSLVFKVQPQNNFMRGWQPARDAWKKGAKVIKAIGYDNGAQDCRRRVKADKAVAKQLEDGGSEARHYEYWYPLQEWEIDRVQCLQLITMAGLPIPMKSACWFCPASKKSEVIWLRDTHPVLFQRAIAMEDKAINGKHSVARKAADKTVSTVGLGRTFAWADLAHVNIEEIVETAETLRP